MERLSAFAALVALAITTTVIMFLTAVIIWVLGLYSIYFVLFVCMPFYLLLAAFDVQLLSVCVGNIVHSMKLKRAEEEHRCKVRKEQREVDLQMRRLRLFEYRRRIHRDLRMMRRSTLKHHPSANPTGDPD
jgi:hypothetical protein